MEIIIEENLSSLKNLKKLEDKKPLLELIGNHLLNIVSESFQDEKSATGKAWKKNAPRTIRKKGSKKILHDSGMLVTSIDYNVNKDEVIIGTNKKYAAIHQFGGRAGRNRAVKIEARPFLPIENKKLVKNVEEEIIDIIKDYINKTIK